MRGGERQTSPERHAPEGLAGGDAEAKAERDRADPDALRTERMLIVSPIPPVRANLVGVLRDGGYAAEAVADLVEACERLRAGAETLMVVVDARIAAGVAPWSASALRKIALAVPALLVIADARRRAALKDAVAQCPRGLLIDRFDLVSVLVCAEMLVGGRMPPGLMGGERATRDGDGAGVPPR